MRLSYVRRVLAPHLRVAVASTQDRWTGVALAGPRARALLGGLAGETPPAHMGLARGRIAGVGVLILAASYSGERAFEIYAPSARAADVWGALTAGAAEAGGGLYGLDAMDLLRIEKGHVVTGAEIDGRTSPGDLGLGKMTRKGGYLGWAGLQRPDFARADRVRLVGLEGVEGALPEGAMVLSRPGGEPEGHITSAGRRVLGEGAIGLGLIRAGPDRLGETVYIASPTRGLSGRARLVQPLFHDPDGSLYRDP